MQSSIQRGGGKYRIEGQSKIKIEAQLRPSRIACCYWSGSSQSRFSRPGFINWSCGLGGVVVVVAVVVVAPCIPPKWESIFSHCNGGERTWWPPIAPTQTPRGSTRPPRGRMQLFPELLIFAFSILLRFPSQPAPALPNLKKAEPLQFYRHNHIATPSDHTPSRCFFHHKQNLRVHRHASASLRSSCSATLCLLQPPVL